MVWSYAYWTTRPGRQADGSGSHLVQFVEISTGCIGALRINRGWVRRRISAKNTVSHLRKCAKQAFSFGVLVHSPGLAIDSPRNLSNFGLSSQPWTTPRS